MVTVCYEVVDLLFFSFTSEDNSRMIRPLTFTHYLRFLAPCKGTCFLTQGGAIFKATVGFLHEFTGLTVEHSQLPEKKCPKNPWRVGDGYA